MKFLIVGLGNKGVQYEFTRHNIGFKIADQLAKDLNQNFNNESFGQLARATYKGKKLIILKPDTYMNLSGNAVFYWIKSEKIPIENVFILTDDLHLNFANIKIKPKGSAAGHNGLKSIEEKLNTQNYSRLKFGIGNDFSKGNQADFVLGNWTEEEQNSLQEKIEFCSKACLSFVFSGLQNTMNNFNIK